MSRRRILLVSYVFPPAGGITVQRALSLAKYLPDCGYEVHVLTARNPAAPVTDPGLLRHVPASVQVHRVFTPELPFHLRKKLWDAISPKHRPSPEAGPVRAGAVSRWKSALGGRVQRAMCPDPQVVWTPFAIRRASEIIEKHNIDVVLVTAPPFSVFLIGNELKRRFPHVKLVTDFRDEWLRFYLTDFDFLGSDHARRRAEAIERSTVELSDLVVAVTRSSVEEIRGRYPEQPAEKFALVSNGYDPDAFSHFTAREHGQSGVVVTHLGTAYRTASPSYYLDALDALPPGIRSEFETRFIGRVAETEGAVLESRNSNVRVLGFMPQDEALRQVEETDYLLLTMTNDFSLPGKLFEYLATGKPILALSPPGGEVDRLLKETGAGWCVDHRDPAAIRELLQFAYQEIKDGKRNRQSDRSAVRRYQRQRLAEELDRKIGTLFPAAAAEFSLPAHRPPAVSHPVC